MIGARPNMNQSGKATRDKRQNGLHRPRTLFRQMNSVESRVYPFFRLRLIMILLLILICFRPRFARPNWPTHPCTHLSVLLRSPPPVLRPIVAPYPQPYIYRMPRTFPPLQPPDTH